MSANRSADDFGAARFTFWRIVGGSAISAYGSYLNLVALGLFAISVTGGALGMGIFMALRIGAAFLAGLVAARLMTRFDRKVLMVGGDLSASIGVGLLAVAPESARTALLFVLAVVLGFCSTVSGVALRTAIPDIVGTQARVRANGLLVTGRSLAMVLGFASAGVIVGFANYEAAFLVDALTFLISAVNLATLPIGGRTPREEPAEQAASADSAAKAATAAGRLARASLTWTPLILGLIVVRAVDNFGSASHQVGMPIYAELIDPAHAAAYVGQFWAVWAIGSMLAHQGSRLVSRLLGTDAAGGRAFAIGTILMSTFFILVFAGLPGPLPWVAAFIAGLADGFTQITYDSRLQAVPAPQRGRVISLAVSAESAALGLGMLISASLLEVLTPLRVVAMMHGIAIVLALGYLAIVLRAGAMAPAVVEQPRELAEQSSA